MCTIDELKSKIKKARAEKRMAFNRMVKSAELADFSPPYHNELDEQYLHFCNEYELANGKLVDLQIELEKETGNHDR